jgi:hypothetical protein
VIRNAIAAGQIPGPRLKACGPEITVTGGLGDERSAHMYRESFAVIADGPLGQIPTSLLFLPLWITKQLITLL